MLDVAKLKSMRESRGLTQEQAAKAAKLGSKQAWWNIESGRQRNLTLDTLGAIAKALKCKPAELLK